MGNILIIFVYLNFEIQGKVLPKLYQRNQRYKKSPQIIKQRQSRSFYIRYNDIDSQLTDGDYNDEQNDDQSSLNNQNTQEGQSEQNSEEMEVAQQDQKQEISQQYPIPKQGFKGQIQQQNQQNQQTSKKKQYSKFDNDGKRICRIRRRKDKSLDQSNVTEQEEDQQQRQDLDDQTKDIQQDNIHKLQTNNYQFDNYYFNSDQLYEQIFMYIRKRLRLPNRRVIKFQMIKNYFNILEPRPFEWNFSIKYFDYYQNNKWESLLMKKSLLNFKYKNSQLINQNQTQIQNRSYHDCFY